MNRSVLGAMGEAGPVPGSQKDRGQCGWGLGLGWWRHLGEQAVVWLTCLGSQGRRIPGQQVVVGKKGREAWQSRPLCSGKGWGCPRLGHGEGWLEGGLERPPRVWTLSWKPYGLFQGV